MKNVLKIVLTVKLSSKQLDEKFKTECHVFMAVMLMKALELMTNDKHLLVYASLEAKHVGACQLKMSARSLRFTLQTPL